MKTFCMMALATMLLSGCAVNDMTTRDSTPSETKLAVTKSDWQGKDLRVEDINNGGVIDFAQTDMRFDSEGKVTGSTGCNQFFGQYSVTDTGLEIGPLATTKRACPPAVMDQEQKFLSVMSDVTRIEKDEVGRLFFKTSDTRYLRAIAQTETD